MHYSSVTAAASAGSVSPPAELGCDVAQQGVDDVRVVVDAELVGDGEQEGVGRRDRLVLRQLFDQLFGLTGVRPAEPGRAAFEISDLVLAAGLLTEVGPVEVTDQWEDASADRDPRLTVVTRRLPGVLEPLDLLGLQPVER